MRRSFFSVDSITEAWEHEGEGKAIWERYYTPRQALNLGIGGDQTQHVLWRIENGNLAGLRPKVIVLLIGTNNSSTDTSCVAPIAEGVCAIVRHLREKLPDTKILLMAILPRGEYPNSQRGNILQANEIIAHFADGQHVYWLDIGSRFVRDDGTISREIMPDFLHLSECGYGIWAAAMENTLSGILGDKAIEMTPERQK